MQAPAPPISPAAIPSGPPVGATGGYATPQAIGAMQPLSSFEVRTNSGLFNPGGPLNFDIIRVGYLWSLKVVHKGTLNVTIPAGGSVTAGDPRNIFRDMSVVFQGINRVRALTPIAENIIDGLDFPVLAPKAQFSVSAGANPFYLEFPMLIPVSETNLLGVIYEGGGATYPQLQLNCNTVTSVLTTAGGATASLDGVGGAAGSGGSTVDLYTRWADAPAPAPGRTVQVNGKPQYYPPQGLFRETRNMKQSQEFTRQPIGAQNSQVPIELPRGPVYSRIILIAYWGGVVDANDQLLSGVNLDVQQITGIQRLTLDLNDMNYRQMYFKQRPGGIWVLSFIDRTSSDRDLLYTRQLGKLTLTPLGSAAIPPANSFVQVITETLVPLQAPGVI